jgi:hypothetical protein
MPDNTTNMSLKKAVDADEVEAYLDTHLAGSLDTLDAHRHRGGSSGLLVDTLSATQAAGDLFYATGANALTRLAIGTASQYLQVTGGVPAWATLATVTRAGGNTTEATTTSTSVVDLVTVSGLNITATTPFIVVANVRKSAGAAAAAAFGLKLNATTVIDGDIASGSGVLPFTTADAAQSGLVIFFVGSRVATYLRSAFGIGMSNASVSGNVQGGGAATADMPTVAITDVIIRADSGSASVTVGVDEVHVYALPTS